MWLFGPKWQKPIPLFIRPPQCQFCNPSDHDRTFLHELASSTYHCILPCEKMHFGSTCSYLKMKDVTQGDRSFFVWGFVSSARLLHSVRSRGWVWMLPEILLPPGKTSRDQTEPWKYLIQTLGYKNFPLYFYIIKSRCSRHIAHWKCLELDTGQDLHADTNT